MSTIAQNNLEQVDKKVLEAVQSGAKAYMSVYQDVFRVQKPERKDERFTIVTLDNSVLEVADGGAYPESSVQELGANQITQKVFKSAVPISDLSEVFDNYGAIAEAAGGKTYQMKYTIDALGVAFLNNATSTTAPYGININGTTTSLISTTNVVGNTGQTYANQISGVLDKTVLNEMWTAMKKMPRHDNIPGGYQAQRLVIPVEQMQNAWQLTQSPEEPESANRNLNFTKTLGLQLIPWQLLTSTDNCFLMADASAYGANGLRMLIVEPPTIRRILSQTTGNWVYQLRMILNAGVTNWQGIVGNVH